MNNNIPLEWLHLKVVENAYKVPGSYGFQKYIVTEDIFIPNAKDERALLIYLLRTIHDYGLAHIGNNLDKVPNYNSDSLADRLICRELNNIIKAHPKIPNVKYPKLHSLETYDVFEGLWTENVHENDPRSSRLLLEKAKARLEELYQIYGGDLALPYLPAVSSPAPNFTSDLLGASINLNNIFTRKYSTYAMVLIDMKLELPYKEELRYRYLPKSIQEVFDSVLKEEHDYQPLIVYCFCSKYPEMSCCKYQGHIQPIVKDKPQLLALDLKY